MMDVQIMISKSHRSHTKSLKRQVTVTSKVTSVRVLSDNRAKETLATLYNGPAMVPVRLAHERTYARSTYEEICILNTDWF